MYRKLNIKLRYFNTATEQNGRVQQQSDINKVHNSQKHAASWTVSVAACCGNQRLSFSWSPQCCNHWCPCHWTVWELHDLPRPTPSCEDAGQIVEPDSAAFLPCRDYT